MSKRVSVLRAEQQARAQKIAAVRLRIQSNRANVFPLITGASGDGWAAPIPFHDIDLPVFPVAVLPQWLRDYVAETATALQVPVDLTGLLGLGIIATACAKRVTVVVRSGWPEPLNLYLAAVLPSGEGKSPAFRSATKPVRDYQDGQVSGIMDEIAEAKLRQSLLQAQRKHLIKETLKQSVSAADAQAKVQDVDKELRALVVPPTPRLVIDDVTGQRLAVLLDENGERLALLSDEAGIFAALAVANAPLDIWLKAWDGGEVHVDRITRPPIHLRKPLLTAVLTPQPVVLEGLAQKPMFRGRGLIARFCFVVPRSLVGYRAKDAASVPDDVVLEYHRHVTALLDQPPGGELTLSSGAYDRFVEFKQLVEVQLRPYGALAELADWGNKLPGTTARLAGLLHMADHASDRTPYEIPEQTMARAIQVADYLIPHARAAFALMAADKTIGPAKWLLGYLIKDGAATFSLRDLCRALHRRVSWLKPVLRTLEEHGYIRPRPTSSRSAAGGRPASQVYEVNPAALSRE
jgi:replicative DNA helicase